MTESELNIMEIISSAIAGSDEWAKLERQDALILDAQASLDSVLKQVSRHIPKDLFIQLEDAILPLCAAHSELGILHGIYVAQVIREVSACPGELSKHILRKLNRTREAQ